MYQVIARKFRPQRFDDVVGQEHVTQVLKNAIELNRVPHALIFSGPRGVGKTSIARILAKALNCEQGPCVDPCNKCGICEDITGSRSVDVFEIDAASHTGVDNIRDLIENSRYAPSIARYKTFIIDEVHMLSRSAFNALLKTLEEPPSHVIFIMATTELQKVPVTVLSRCQRYDFRRICVDEIVSHLSTIAGQEGINISNDALIMIAMQAEGGMRDAQGMLEHLAASGIESIGCDTVEDMLGLVGRSTMNDLLRAILSRDVTGMLDVVDKVYQYGQDLSQLYRSILEQLRNAMVLKAGYAKIALPQQEIELLNEMINNAGFEEIHRALSVLIRSEEDLKYSSVPKITLETILLRVASGPRLSDLQQLIESVSTNVGHDSLPKIRKTAPAHTPKKPISSLPVSWEGFIAFLKDHDHPIFAMLSQARLKSEDDGRVVLLSPNSFITEQIKKGMPEINKRVKTFYRREMPIVVDTDENKIAAEKKPKPSELRSEALKSTVVKEIMSEFSGVVKDVKIAE